VVSRRDLDLLTAGEVVDLLLAGETRVLPAVRTQAAAIAAAADAVAARWAEGGRLILVGAGTSGRLAWLQAGELRGTFGIDRHQALACVAGGLDATDGDEDDVAAALRDHERVRPGPSDVVVAVAASGSTPYTVSFARAASEAGATVVSVTTVAGSPLAELAHVAIEARVGPEVLRGSTRLGAGTAQKVVLDALTTAAAARLGRVHADHMIDVVGANAKLRDRVAGIVADVAGCSPERAAEAVAACDGNARAAVLVLVHRLEPGTAVSTAAAHRTLRDALAAASRPLDTPGQLV
jgi:N-acetylmuramic acid 6-phosphate etherase